MTFVRNKPLWVALLLFCAAVAALVVANTTRGAIGDGTWRQSDLALGQPALYRDPIEEL
jgi:hypothetical protein